MSRGTFLREDFLIMRLHKADLVCYSRLYETYVRVCGREALIELDVGEKRVAGRPGLEISAGEFAFLVGVDGPTRLNSNVVRILCSPRVSGDEGRQTRRSNHLRDRVIHY